MSLIKDLILNTRKYPVTRNGAILEKSVTWELCTVEGQQYFLQLKMELFAINYLVASESGYSNMLWCAVAEGF